MSRLGGWEEKFARALALDTGRGAFLAWRSIWSGILIGFFFSAR